MGLHGAALVHGLFQPENSVIIELKTLYGFTSGLFPLVADARKNYLGQVDVRDYWVPGGHKPMDEALVTRVIHTLQQVLRFRHHHQQQQQQQQQQQRLQHSEDVITTTRKKKQKKYTFYSNQGQLVSKSKDVWEPVDFVDLNPTNISNAKGRKWVDAIVGPVRLQGGDHSGLEHMLGPKIENVQKVCSSTILYSFRNEILGESNSELHCAGCSPFIQ